MKKIVLPTLIIASVYFLSTTYLMNSRLAIGTLTGNYPLTYKFNLMTALILGMWAAMGAFGLTILLTTAILVGANLSILVQRLATMSKLGNVHLVAGGSSLFSLATSGCAACGLPVLSLLGVSGSLIFLPFHGQELTYLSLILSLVSLVLLIKTGSANTCALQKQTVKDIL